MKKGLSAFLLIALCCVMLVGLASCSNTQTSAQQAPVATEAAKEEPEKEGTTEAVATPEAAEKATEEATTEQAEQSTDSR